MKRNYLKNKKLYIIISVVIGVILILFSKSNIMQQLNQISKSKIEKEEIAQDKFSYIVYDNTQEKLKVLVNIERQDGINRIEYTDYEGNNTTFKGNEKNKIDLDFQFEIGKDYKFNIISKEREDTEIINIKEDYIKDFIKILEVENNKVKIDTVNVSDEVTLKYKIGSEEALKNYSEPFVLNNISNITDVSNEDYATINIIKQDKAKNVVSLNSKYSIDKDGDFDVFRNVQVSGKTMREYGFTPSWTNSEYTSFQPYNINCGHHTDSETYSSVFKLDYTRLKKVIPKELYVEFMQYSEGSGAWAKSSVNVYYKDGTTELKEVNTKTSGGWSSYPVSIDVQNKEINYIEFKIWGRDECWVTSLAYIKNIILKRSLFRFLELIK